MDADTLARDLIKRAGSAQRFLVAIAGPPGSGKSTLSGALCDALRKSGETAVVVPMDGYHLDNIVLDARGHRNRKGAPHTFDASGFVHLIQRIKAREPQIAIPVFDRSIDLSRAAAEIVEATTRFILVEGLYLLLTREPWNRLKPLFDFSVFLKPNKAEIERRLIVRWEGLGRDAEFARHWMEVNDFPNLDIVVAESAQADLVVTED